MDVRRFFGKRRPRRVVRRRLAWRRRRGPMGAMRARLARTYTPMFTETVKMNDIVFNANSPGVSASILRASFNEVPQVNEYTALYNQYCIKKLQWILVPAYNVYDQPASGSAVAPQPRLVYAIQDSAQQVAPNNELDVLEDNGARIVPFTKPVRITHYPVAQVGVSSSTGGFVSETKRNRWLSTATTDTLHAGVSYAFTQSSSFITGNPVLATVYCKITFALRDPK